MGYIKIDSDGTVIEQSNETPGDKNPSNPNDRDRHEMPDLQIVEVEHIDRKKEIPIEVVIGALKEIGATRNRIKKNDLPN